MTRREEGFLLLTSHLGDPYRRCLTTGQLERLADCTRGDRLPDPDAQLDAENLMKMGCDLELADRAVALLNQQELLERYLHQGMGAQCVPLTRISQGYPGRLRGCLKTAAPGCIWLKGDLRLLSRPAVSLVGSRDLNRENAAFAHAVGELAARYGYVLISGNARGADTVAQESCLAAGGGVISVVADRLMDKSPRRNVLYLSEDGYDLPFTSQRALSRNRLIHSMGQRTFVAQSGCGSGGTWSGTVRNLKEGWSAVFCFSDGSEGAKQLRDRGAILINSVELHDVFGL